MQPKLTIKQLKPKRTIEQLFNDEEIHFRIPTYQRAYSWGDTQVKQFLDDIKEQNPEKKYFLGIFCLSAKTKILIGLLTDSSD